MLVRILIGFLIAVLGFSMVWKTEFFINTIGLIEWAELHLGGSRMFYKLLGIVIILLGFLVITNLFDLVIGGFISSVFTH